MDEELKEVLNAFLDSPDLVWGIVASTCAGFGGSAYSVELFHDGTWRVLWNNQIGNRYDSPGIILGIPALDDQDYDDLMDIVNAQPGHDKERTIQEEQQWLRDELAIQLDILDKIKKEMQAE